MIDHINPTFKTLALIAGTIALGFTYRWELNVAVIILAYLCLLTSKHAKLLNVLLITIPMFFISVSYFFTAWLFPSSAEATHTTAHMIINPAVTNGINLGTRLSAFASIGVAYGMTTDKDELIASFIQQGRMPMSMGYAILTALNLTNLIHQEYKQSQLAFQVRNMKSRWFDTKALFTMLIRMTRWADQLALAMETKGFSEDRTMKLQVRVHWYDYLFLIGFPSVIIVVGILL